MKLQISRKKKYVWEFVKHFMQLNQKHNPRNVI